MNFLNFRFVPISSNNIFVGVVEDEGVRVAGFFLYDGVKFSSNWMLSFYVSGGYLILLGSLNTTNIYTHSHFFCTFSILVRKKKKGRTI